MSKQRLTYRQRRLLRDMVRSATDVRLYTRALALLLLDEGTEAAQVASWLGVSRSSVLRWQHRFHQHHDATALHERPGRGRPSLRSGSLLTTLQQALRGSWATGAAARASARPSARPTAAADDGRVSSRREFLMSPSRSHA
jgi:hypothetical protein